MLNFPIEKFTEEDDYRLLYCLRQAHKEKKCLDSNYLMWDYISEMMGDKSFLQCRHRWYGGSFAGHIFNNNSRLQAE
jgi:hypothetical protein